MHSETKNEDYVVPLPPFACLAIVCCLNRAVYVISVRPITSFTPLLRLLLGV